MLPSTRYAKSGDIHVAYQVFGNGEIDLVFFPGFVSNIEIYWEEPHFARWLRKLASFSRVITFDKRGTGLSDRLEILPTMYGQARFRFPNQFGQTRACVGISIR